MLCVVVIVIVITILLLSSIIVRMDSMKGGAYLSYESVDDNEDKLTIPPSLHIRQSVNVFGDMNSVICDIVHASDEIRRNCTVNIFGNEYRNTKLTPSRLSDANIDFEIFANSFHALNGFAVCEYESLYTRMDCEEDVCKLKNHLVSYLEDYKIVATKTDKGFIKLSKRKHDVNIYIEFMYSSIRNVVDAYTSIHLFIIDLIPKIKENLDNTKSNVFVFKIRVKTDGSIDNTKTIMRTIENEEWKVMSFVIGDIGKPTIINVPSTSISLSMDEYICFVDNENKSFSIQIEHSEGLNKHKNNMFEFLLRTIGYDNKDKRRNIYNERVYMNDTSKSCSNLIIKLIENTSSLSDNNNNARITKYLDEKNGRLPIEINDFILVISTMVKYGYYFDRSLHFVTNMRIDKTSPFYLAWPEFANRYLNIRK